MDKSLTPQQWELIFYTSPEWDVKLSALFQDETIWLSQKQMGELFEVETNTINYHLSEIFKSWELSENSVIRKIGITASDGKIYDTKHYNLDTIIAVGYRVNSYKATKFRMRATQVLKEYMTKGFAMNDERLKNGQLFGKDYFDEWLARIREIRASERRFYQKITDIYATSVDYDPHAPITRDFFAEVQNKFLYAVSEKTAPELWYYRADHKKSFMGLTSRKGQKRGDKIVETDIKIWKNYLTEKELDNLNLLVSQYLDFAEYQAKNWIIMTMKDWIERTKNFFELNHLKILKGKWSISREDANEKVQSEFEKFRVTQDQNYFWDFDKFVKEVQRK